MKVLLFGRNGQVGWELQRSLAPLGDLIALDRAGSQGLCGDLADPDGVARTVRTVHPDVIVNAAAYTAVDKAESDADAARTINAIAPGAMAAAAREVDALLVHYSTDYVFDGSGTRPWTETDSTGPLGVYGQTKLEGEQRIAQVLPRHLVLRTSWVYGARGGNFARTMLRLARDREELKVVADQVGAPTGADLLADVTAHAVRALLGGQGAPGIYHVAASGATSWHAYARFVLMQAQGAGQPLKAGPDRVLPIPSSAFATPARRPHNSRLATTRFQTTFDLALPPWEQGVARMLQEIL